ncbi:hypothetical protein GALL_185810 [mine drainage metagenome]|uniref:BNR/Asp-box repeat protein n=1 Tax=mine drainage metagenome TaxID=410659 RepID=A0A1J5RSR8_9ZZZZ
MKALSTVLLVWLACFSLAVFAHESLALQSDLAVSVAFDAAGNVWRVGVNAGVVQVDVSRDLAKTFSKPVTISSPIQPTVLGDVADKNIQPQITIGHDGNIYVVWTEASSNASAGAILFSRSVNGGKSFEKPVIVSKEHTKAVTLNVAPNGKVTLIWQVATGSDVPEAIDYAVSANGGASFESAQKLADGGSVCGSISTANKPDGTVTAMWQHQFDNGERDYILAEIPAVANQPPVIKRATYEHGKTDACAEGGSALAVGGVGMDWWGYHMAYFSGNLKKPGLYYSRMDGVAWASSPAKRFGNHQLQAGQPAMLSLGDSVWLVWREVEGKNNQILGMFSDDGGKSWQDAKVLASTADQAGYPQLIAQGKQVYLAWSTQQEGFRLIALPM